MGKKHNREDREDRCFPYRDFRWKMNFGAVQDADHIEYTKINDQIVYVSVMELTLVETNDKYPEPNKAYLKAIIDRYDKEMQGIFIKKLASVFSDPNGEWIWVSDFALKKGIKKFNLKHTDKFGIEHNSDQNIIVFLEGDASEQPIIVKYSDDGPGWAEILNKQNVVRIFYT